ncbi:MAG TPA: taurine catabolism dioxygenase TauD [Rhizobiales bacterium]|nr:taurine catabolism dioxygenase TauD [Hyphomicrobiales bacterium]
MNTAVSPNPYRLDNPDGYLRWREKKLENAPRSAGDLVVEIKDPEDLKKSEFDALMTRLRRWNMALYDTGGRDVSKAALRHFGLKFGLSRLDANPYSDEDAVTSLKVKSRENGAIYIPYTSRPISWHTDGYYNSAERQVRGILLHCAQPAASGGENAIMDPEMAYIHLRDLDPEYITALSADDAMSIPPNEVNDFIEREESVGPVFSVLDQGALHMRFTARKRHIKWKSDPVTTKAVAALMDFLDSDTPYIYRHLMQKGQGLIGNNPLHDRAGFSDEDPDAAPRLLYRARYHDRIAGTDVFAF